MKAIGVMAAAVIGLGLICAPVSAQTNSTQGQPFELFKPGKSDNETVSGKGQHADCPKGKHTGMSKEEFEQLQQLKKTDPEKFKQVMREKERQARARLQDLKQKDPEKYRQVMEHLKARRDAQLETLKKEDPEKYRQIMERRREHSAQKLERLKTENPEKYKEIMQRSQRIRELQKMNQEDPAKFRQYLKTHPEARELLFQMQEHGQGNERKSGKRK